MFTKKNLLVIALAFITVAINAQFYVGGSLGYSSVADKNDDGEKTSSTSNFSFAPKVGYDLNEKFSVGLGFSLGNSGIKTYDSDGDELANPKVSTWEITPFARYTVAEFGKISLLGEGIIFWGGTTTDSGISNSPKVKSSTYGLNIAPIIAFAATNRISIEASLNFLNLRYSSEKPDTDFDATRSRFNFGVNSDNLINTNSIQLGFIYKL